MYEAKTYYNLTEKDTRMIERMEVECLSKKIETDQNCPTYLFYLETGQLPARCQVQIMMINFQKYILNQKGDSLVSR